MIPELTLAYISDAGEPGTLQDQTAALIAGWDVDALLTAGNNSGFSLDSLTACWAAFLALGVPIYPAWGNKDYDNDIQASLALFPDLPAPFGHSRWYHTQLNGSMLRLAVWSSFKDPDYGYTQDEQDTEMTAAIASALEWWKIGVCHIPPVTGKSGGANVDSTMESLLTSGAYDLLLFGKAQVNEEILCGGTRILNVSTSTQSVGNVGLNGTQTQSTVTFPAVAVMTTFTVSITGVGDVSFNSDFGESEVAEGLDALLTANGAFTALYSSYTDGSDLIILRSAYGALAAVTGVVNGYALTQLGSTTEPLQGYLTEAVPIWDDPQHHCAVKLRITLEAIRWEIYDVETGDLLRTGGIGPRRARGTTMLHAPLELPATEGAGARMLAYQKVLHSVARRGGLIPEQDGLEAGIAIQITEGANAAVKYAWEFYDWPELVRWQEMTPVADAAGNPVIPWRSQTALGWQEIGVVLAVHSAEEATCYNALSYELRPAGIEILSELPDTGTVWVRWRPMPPEFTSTVWDSEVTYPRDSLVYDPDTGHVYRAFVEAAAGTVVSNDTIWGLVPIPHILAEPVKAGAEALFLRSEGQYGTATILESAMLSLLEHEIIQIQNQQQQSKFTRRY